MTTQPGYPGRSCRTVLPVTYLYRVRVPVPVRMIYDIRYIIYHTVCIYHYIIYWIRMRMGKGSSLTVAIWYLISYHFIIIILQLLVVCCLRSMELHKHKHKHKHLSTIHFSEKRENFEKKEKKEKKKKCLLICCLTCYCYWPGYLYRTQYTVLFYHHHKNVFLIKYINYI